MAKIPKYPRTLYKSPGTQKFVTKGVHYTYDSLVVNDDNEFDTALDMGYIDSFSDAIFHKPKFEKGLEEKDDALREGF